MKRLRDRLPPANSMVVFEAVARHLSFTRAAKELRVSQAAVSRQVKLKFRFKISKSSLQKLYFFSIRNIIKIRFLTIPQKAFFEGGGGTYLFPPHFGRSVISHFKKTL